MREPKVAAIILSLLSTVGCSGMTGLMPTGPSASMSPSQSMSSLAPLSQSISSLPPSGASEPTPQVITGTVNPLAGGGPRCYLGLYSCEVYSFSLASSGGVDVTLAWEGGDRDMMVQLYRADVGLMHEDIAPRGGGVSRISFRRPDLAAMDYEIRVVNLQRDEPIPFTLRFTRWEN